MTIYDGKARESYFLKKIETQINEGRLEEALNTLQRINIATVQNSNLQELKHKSDKFYIVNEMKQIKINKTNNSPNVLFGTMEIANLLNLYSQGIQKLGTNARVLNYYPTYLSYQTNYSFNIADNTNKHLEKDLQEIVYQAIDTFDVFHFMFNTTLMPNYSDLPLLKKAGKKIYMHNAGSEVRRYSIGKQFNKYNIVKNPNEQQIIRELEILGGYIDDVIVADAEMYEYVKQYYKKVHFVRQPIDLNVYKPLDDFEFKRNKPVIVHAPTSVIKGSKWIFAAIEELKKTYDFEFILVKNMSHEQAKEIYRNADIIVDQILAGSHGQLAIEAMAMNKPVVCYISDFMKASYPKDLPIVSADPSNIKKVLEKLINDYEFRKEIGEKGRPYVEKYHEVNKVSKQLMGIYNSDVRSWR